MVNRAERRAMAAQMREQARSWPPELRPVPESEWPEKRPGQTHYPFAVWRSRRFLALLYAEAPFGNIEVVRLTVNRVTIQSDGQFEQDITWDELQMVKRQIGHGDQYAVEIYPRDRDAVTSCNMRHLWLLSEPLPIGWFAR